jgi:hypothetical protein
VERRKGRIKVARFCYNVAGGFRHGHDEMTLDSPMGRIGPAPVVQRYGFGDEVGMGSGGGRSAGWSGDVVRLRWLRGLPRRVKNVNNGSSQLDRFHKWNGSNLAMLRLCSAK